MRKYKDLTGERFGRLVVIKHAYQEGARHYWLCKCDCGNEKLILGCSLKYGKTKSCGCLAREKTIERNKLTKSTHKMSNTRIFKTWMRMKSRCLNQNTKDYKNYGGRGITICQEWLDDFMNFYNWSMANGYKDTLSIDRINVNGNYEPSNCRWATIKVQNNNKRSCCFIEFNGEKHSIAEWSKKLKINKNTLQSRLKRYGWSIEDVLKRKVKRNIRNGR